VVELPLVLTVAPETAPEFEILITLPEIVPVKPGVGVGVGVGLGVGVGVGIALTVTVKGDLNTAPLESHACTTTLCVPEVTARLTSRFAADVE
jgi:hypothetical protein